MSLEKLFLHKKTVNVLLRILEAEEKSEKIYPLQISNDVGSPYSYISKILGDFEKNALIESKLKGRVRVIKLTEYGRRIALMLRELREELKKDFLARRKLEVLKNVLKDLNGKDPFKILAPVIAELKILKKSTNDREVIEEIEKLEKKIEGILT